MTEAKKTNMTIGVDVVLKFVIATGIGFVGYVGNDWRSEATLTRAEMIGLRVAMGKLTDRMGGLSRDLEKLADRVERVEINVNGIPKK